MNWRNLALKNIRRTARRYLGYLLASALAVTVFCMFTIFVDNPAVQKGYLTQTAREVLSVSRIVVALFAIFFVFSFHASLMRLRNKEIGLLITLGMLPRQVGRLIFAESLCIGLVALAAGLICGIGGSGLFLLAMDTILALPKTLPFVIPASAIWATMLFFGIVFLVEASLVSWRIVQSSPRLLLLGARVQQTPPRPSWLLVVAALLCLVLAYDLALQFSTLTLLTMIPIIILTAVGTYFLLSQVFVFMLNRLRRSGLHGIALLIVARLAYRLRDNARMMTLVTLLNAAVVTGMGAVFGVLVLVQMATPRFAPFTLQLASNTAHPAAITSTQVRHVAETQGLNVQKEVDSALLTAQITNTGYPLPVSVLSLSAFRSLHEAALQAHPEFRQHPSMLADLHADQAYVYPATLGDKNHQVQLQVGTYLVSLSIQQSTIKEQVLNQPGVPETESIPQDIVIVADQVYAHLNSIAPPTDHWHISSFVILDWQQSGPVITRLQQYLPNTEQGLLTGTAISNVGLEQLLSVMLFAGFFISSLFFLAAGCSIYFKLFTQQEEDRRQFQALERVGLLKREAGWVLSIEFLLLFFLPVGLGIGHSAVALSDLVHLLAQFGDASQAIVPAFGKVCLLYVVSFLVYFIIARVHYLRRVYTAIA
jgi:hypothetical protein